jgi:hypothetical protein
LEEVEVEVEGEEGEGVAVEEGKPLPPAHLAVD